MVVSPEKMQKREDPTSSMQKLSKRHGVYAAL
jgi:hypothetical protein